MISSIILGSIGNNMTNEENDVFAVKESLQDLGRMSLCL